MPRSVAASIIGTLAVVAARTACAPPAAASPLQSLDCGTAGATLRFAFASSNVYTGAGQFSVPGTSFCVAVSGAIPSDGSPAIQLQPCPATVGSDAAFLFSPMLDGSMISNLNGLCLDLVSGVQAPNELLELFGCNGGANQFISFNATTGRLVVPKWGYCIGIC